MSDGLIGAASILTRTSLAPTVGRSMFSNLATKKTNVILYIQSLYIQKKPVNLGNATYETQTKKYEY